MARRKGDRAETARRCWHATGGQTEIQQTTTRLELQADGWGKISCRRDLCMALQQNAIQTGTERCVAAGRSLAAKSMYFDQAKTASI